MLPQCCRTTACFKMSRQRTNLADRRFGKPLVISPAGKDKHDRCQWICRCDCGIEMPVSAAMLVNGQTGSCKGKGCHRRTLHGESDSPTYRIWIGMKKRCSQDHKYFRNYAGRGITICDEWKHSFPNFLRDMGIRPEGMSLDRINNDGSYEPTNCRWATLSEQSRNKRQVMAIGNFTDSEILSEYERRGLGK